MLRIRPGRRALVLAMFAQVSLAQVIMTLGAAPARAQPAPPLVAAAADLQFALTEIAAQFRATTGQELRLSFGASGNITRQIEQGSPVELFLSADESFVFRLAEGGHTLDRGVLYAIGHLALFTPPGSPIAASGGMEAIRAALAAGQITRFAIANPEHAPYGRAAQQALRSAGLWDAIAPRIVLGENVAQAAQFAIAGGSQGGIVAYSLVLAPTMRGRGAFTRLPETLHEPLRQRMVLTRRAGPGATAFYAYLQQEAAREIMRRYGFALPGE